VAEQGYTIPTPIQAQAIPFVLAGRDLLGAAQTGTGKTAGFTLPMLQRLAENQPKGTGENPPRGVGKHPIRALILVPTRELAAQVHESVRNYGKHMNLRSCMIFGGVGFNPQVTEIRRGVDIVVATPGRLLDHMQQRTIDLKSVEILVLDEADRMLDMGFIHDIRRVIAVLPAVRQNLLFSATFSDDIRKLSGTILKDPATVEVARRNAPIELVAQSVYHVDRDRKRELLAHLIKTGDWHQVLVFTKTKHGANRLAQQLEKEGIQADAIHGNKSQPARTKALKRFKDNELQVLVATDIAARGLDIELLPHVVNYDLPNVSEDYVHRIGRTGRAGSTGEAISLVSADDRPLLRDIEKLINRKIEEKTVDGFAPTKGGGTAEVDDRPPMQPRNQQRRGQQQPRGNAGRTQAPRPSTRNATGERPQQARRGDQQPRRGDQQPRSNENARPQRPQGARPGARTGAPRPQQGQAQSYHQRPAAPMDRLEEERLAQLREGQRLARSEMAEQPQEAAKTSGGIFGFLKRKIA
jgi:ATP-dependent RNA helicase RhlE